MAVLSRLNPVPALPAYTGPYGVGTQDVEIPISQLSTSVPALDPSISTVNFRLFYPCQREQRRRARPVYWLPEPQGEYWRAYARFLQASPWLASLLSCIPIFGLIRYTAIPVIRDARPLSPTAQTDGRWPVMIFSHGLGGSKNAYSQMCGSLASHGLVVVAPDHRDGSAPISFIRETTTGPGKAVNYRSLPHASTSEVEEGRNTQLRIRCWELGLIHDALLKADRGEKHINIRVTRTSENHLAGFESLLDVHRPGRIAWAGHSFGATTIVQFVKSIFHGESSLYAASQNPSLQQQITASSPITLLDLWTLPLLFQSTSSLWSQPLPFYSSSADESQGKPSPPLAILSEAFHKWKSNLRDTIRTVSPSSDIPSPNKHVKPHIFYPVSSAHLSQSDFGVLFPWITKKALKAEEPDRTMRLNVRAILESLRRSGIHVTDTSKLDMEIQADQAGLDVQGSDPEDGLALGQDQKILAADGSVRGWMAIDPNVELGKSKLNGNPKAENTRNGHAVNRQALNGHAKEADGADNAALQETMETT